MSQPLPTGDFTWMTEEEIETLNVETLDDETDEGKTFMAEFVVIWLFSTLNDTAIFIPGLILEVDLDHPEHLHDLHNVYPLALEKMKMRCCPPTAESLEKSWT